MTTVAGTECAPSGRGPRERADGTQRGGRCALSHVTGSGLPSPLQFSIALQTQREVNQTTSGNGMSVPQCKHFPESLVYGIFENLPPLFLSN